MPIEQLIKILTYLQEQGVKKLVVYNELEDYYIDDLLMRIEPNKNNEAELVIKDEDF